MKFLKFIKADKLIPAKLMKKLEGVGGEKKMGNIEKDIGKTDLLQKKVDFDLTKCKTIYEVNEKLRNYRELLDIKYLIGDVERGIESAKILEKMCEHIKKDIPKIKSLSKADYNEFVYEFNKLGSGLYKIVNSENLDFRTIKRYNVVIENHYSEIYNILNINLPK